MPALGVLDRRLQVVPLRGLDQPEEDVLHVLADVARLRERRGIDDGERHVQDPGEGLRQEGLAAAGGPDQQDVALWRLDVRLGEVDPLEVVVDGDGERALRPLLPDHVLAEDLEDVLRLGQRVAEVS